MMLVHIPAIFPPDDDLLIRLSQRNPGFKIERDASGEITMAPPNGGFGGAKSGEAFAQLYDYARRAGGKAFDASQGWKIGPTETIRSPDASWLSQAQVDAIPPNLRSSGKLLAVVPDIAIEVKSPSDDWPTLLRKLAEYRSRGCAYAVAIDPETRDVVTLGTTPPDCRLDFDAIIDA